MPFDVDQLWLSLADACKSSPQSDIEEALAAASDRSHLSPWTFWTLICLARHHARQQWVAEIVKHRLSGEPTELAVAGALAHPPIAQQGLVPGDTQWEYFFHGRGCCLTNRVTGESIDVDFFDATADWIDSFFYFNHLRSLKTPEPPEARLLGLHPSREAILLAIEELLALGCLVRFEEEKAFKVAADVLARTELIDKFCQQWLDEDLRPWVAVSVGDWLVAEESASKFGHNVAVRLRENADLCRKRRLKQLEQHFSRSNDFLEKRTALLAITELQSPRLDEYLEGALAAGIDGLTSTAIDIVCDRNDPNWCESVFRLFGRINPAGPIPHAYVGVRCAKYLLKQGYRTETVTLRLLEFKNRESAEAAILALEYAPQYCLQLFRYALRSSVPAERQEAAAALAILDLPWCHLELARVLAESSDQIQTCECRAALAASRDSVVQQIAILWEESNPHEAEVGPYITFGEMSLRDRHVWLQYKIEQLHDRVIRLRNRQTPPEGTNNRWRWFRWLFG